MPRYTALNNLELEYAFPDLKHLSKSGMFIAVKIIEYFIQISIKGGKLQFSNFELVGKFRCSLRGLQDAFVVLESDGIVKRTFKDDRKFERSEFILDLDKAYNWLSLHKYDKEYINAPKRSLLRAFVNQSTIFVKNVKERIIKAFGLYKNSKDKELRKSKIEAFKKQLDKQYQRYVKHLQERSLKIQQYKEKKEKSQLLNDAINVFYSFLSRISYTPPDLSLI